MLKERAETKYLHNEYDHCNTHSSFKDKYMSYRNYITYGSVQH